MQLKKPLIFAHRGSSVLAPENTIEAFELALSMGAHVLETDVRISQDNRIIVIHDETVDRTTDGSGAVNALPLAALKELDARGTKKFTASSKFSERRILLCTLDELFETFPDVSINIDIKDDSLLAAKLVHQCITAHHRWQLTTVGSFHARTLYSFRKLTPHVPTAAVKSEVANLYFNRWQSTEKLRRSVPFQAVQIPVSWKRLPLATRPFIERMQAIGLQVSYWTINEESQMRDLISKGVDGLVTDRPDLASAVLAELADGHQ